MLNDVFEITETNTEEIVESLLIVAQHISQIGCST